MLINALKNQRESLPNCKLTVSKVLPTGDSKLKIERNHFNANLEKRLEEEENLKVSILDHGNLANQGYPITQYYRNDMIHLSPEGEDIFTKHLRNFILREMDTGENRPVKYYEDNFRKDRANISRESHNDERRHSGTIRI